MGESNSKPKKPSNIPLNKASDKEETKVNHDESKTPTKSGSPTKSGQTSSFQISAGDFIKVKTSNFKEEYVLKEVLGMGAFGEVRKVLHKPTGMIRAAKILKKEGLDAEERKKLLAEVKILTTLDHPHIMRIYEMFEDKSHYFIISEFLPGGELFDRIIEAKNFSEKDAAHIIQQVLSAVSYCHKHNIVHRDLKPENLVYESKNKDANLKVIDFGASRTFAADQKMRDTQGTAYYIAPEILRKDYNEKCDIWSCGVILYILLSGTPPFGGANDNDILKKVKLGKYDFHDQVWHSVSDDAKSFIRKMIEMDPAKRLSAQQALEDPWFKKVIVQQAIDRPLAKANLENLRQFGFESKLQEATWVFLVSYFATKEEKDKLLETFKAIDLDGDGQLTKEELKQGYINIMGMSLELAEEEAENVMKTIDTNHSGSIDYTEFVNATISKTNLLKKDKLETVFKVFDRNGDGRISADEMKFLFSEGKTYGVPEEAWGEWISQVDENGDGGISLDEFKDMMVSLMNKY